MEGHDLPSLLFAYLDEFLFRFSTEAFVVKRATILDLQRPPPSPSEGQEGPEREDAEGGAGMAAAAAYRIRVRAEGEGFDLAKYVKWRLARWCMRGVLVPGLGLMCALSFHIRRHPQGTEIKAITYSNMQIHEKDGRADVYVIVDI